MHSQTIHYKKVDDRVQNDHQICHPQVREGEQPNLAPIYSIEDRHGEVQDVNIGHEESKIEFEKVLSLFSSGNREEVYEGKQYKVPDRTNHTCISEGNQA